MYSTMELLPVDQSSFSLLWNDPQLDTNWSTLQSVNWDLPAAAQDFLELNLENLLDGFDVDKFERDLTLDVNRTTEQENHPFQCGTGTVPSYERTLSETSYFNLPTVKTCPSIQKCCCAKSNKPYVRRPPNAFMIFMRENREKLKKTMKPKHSAEANSLLGQMWREMSSNEKAIYYQMAKDEHRIHAQKYPEWSGSDNYGKKQKKQRRKKMIV